jgi:uncharacterized protein
MSRRAADGRGLLGAFRAAADNLTVHVDEINALNVFPVPDGDTGSNMLATVRAALAEAEAIHENERTADRVAQAISYGALMGARGNSGVIASQIFRGMAEGLGGKQSFDGADLARTLNQGAATAYRAVARPVEGTILTVIREAAAAAGEKSDEGGDLAAVLRAAVEGAEAAVAKTPTLLPVLRDAGVVDAGGQGIFVLLQGALMYLEARVPRRVLRETAQRTAYGRPDESRGDARTVESAEFTEVDLGYETMYILRAHKDSLIDVESLRAELELLGESVLVAGDARAVKVHVHNARPDRVIGLGLSLGSLTRITVENLDAQSHEVREKKAAEAVAAPIDHRLPSDRHETRPGAHVDLATYADAPSSTAKSAVRATGTYHGSRETAEVSSAVPAQAQVTSAPLAVVVVAAGDGLARIFESYGVAAIVRGGQSANPSTGELLDAIERIRADEVLLLPNNPNVVLAARQASEMTSRRVRVVPTRNAAEGFAALLALDTDRDATANQEFMTMAGRAVQTLQVTEAVRDAVVGGRKVHKGQTIVLDPDDGLLAVGNDCVKSVLSALEALEPGFELVTIYWGAGAEETDANTLAKRIETWRPGVEVQVFDGGQPHYRYLLSAE